MIFVVPLLASPVVSGRAQQPHVDGWIGTGGQAHECCWNYRYINMQSVLYSLRVVTISFHFLRNFVFAWTFAAMLSISPPNWKNGTLYSEYLLFQAIRHRLYLILVWCFSLSFFLTHTASVLQSTFLNPVWTRDWQNGWVWRQNNVNCDFAMLFPLLSPSSIPYLGENYEIYLSAWQ